MGAAYLFAVDSCVSRENRVAVCAMVCLRVGCQCEMHMELGTNAFDVAYSLICMWLEKKLVSVCCFNYSNLVRGI